MQHNDCKYLEKKAVIERLSAARFYTEVVCVCVCVCVCEREREREREEIWCSQKRVCAYMTSLSISLPLLREKRVRVARREGRYTETGRER
jgi:hypothetical protein